MGTFAAALRPYRLSLTITLLFCLTGQLVAMARGDSFTVDIAGYLKVFGLFTPLLAIAWLVVMFLHMLLVTRPASPLRAYGLLLKDIFLNPARWHTALPFLVIIMLLNATYVYFKARIPMVLPFSWDVELTRWDRLLHGGTLPWEWLQMVFGYPIVTFILSFIYYAWFVIMISAWLCFAFTRNERAPRQRFLLAFVLNWMIGGSLLATLFSSAGPCYFDRVVDGLNPYAGLMDYLYFVHEHVAVIWALPLQEQLWSTHVGADGDLAGISAMPSMHVATTTLLMFAAWRVNRRLGYAGLLFLLAILIGSVHLGWHYAVDGYVSIVLATGFWWLSGRLLGRYDDGACVIRNA